MLQAVTLTLVKQKTSEKNRKYEKEKKAVASTCKTITVLGIV